jgi:pimeloyl-ACP methyl ester carboxylesterase
MSLSNFDLNQNYYSFSENNSTPIVFIHGVGLDHQMWEASNRSF